MSLLFEIWQSLPLILLFPSIFQRILIGKQGKACRVERVVPIERLPWSLAVSAHFDLSCVVSLGFLDQVRLQLLNVLGWCVLRRHPILRFASYLCVVCWLGGLFGVPLSGWRRIPSELRDVSITVLRVQGCLSFRWNMSRIIIRCWCMIPMVIRAGRTNRISISASNPNSFYKVIVCAWLHPPLFAVKIWMISTGASRWHRDLKTSFDRCKKFGLVRWTRLVDKIARLVI